MDGPTRFTIPIWSLSMRRNAANCWAGEVSGEWSFARPRGRWPFRSISRPWPVPSSSVPLSMERSLRIASEEPVSFEVDRIDDAMSEGWSVLATGTVPSVHAAEQIHEVQALGIEPWAGGERDTYFRFGVTCITGKRINAVR